MEKTMVFKFSKEMCFHYETIPAGRVFMRADEGENGNLYVKPSKKGEAAYNLTRPGIMVFPAATEKVYIRIF